MLICAYVLTCVNIKNEERAQLQSSLDAYVQDINLEKNNAVSKSDYIIKNEFDSIYGDCQELMNMIVASTKTLQGKNNSYLKSPNS